MDSGEYIPSTEEVRDFISKTVWSVAEFDRWLAEHDREVKAEAWSEGHWEGWQNAREALLTDMFGGPTLNPYQQGETK